MDFERCLEIQLPYLGPVKGYYTDWTPLEGRPGLFRKTSTRATPGSSRTCWCDNRTGSVRPMEQRAGHTSIDAAPYVPTFGLFPLQCTARPSNPGGELRRGNRVLLDASRDARSIQTRDPEGSSATAHGGCRNLEMRAPGWSDEHARHLAIVLSAAALAACTPRAATTSPARSTIVRASSTATTIPRTRNSASRYASPVSVA